MGDRPLRLGDVIDDYCPRCRLLMNHDVASMTGSEVAKVTCRTCHNTHDYRHAQVPAKRKTKGKQAQTLMEEVLSSLPPAPTPPPAPPAPGKRRRDLWAELERIKKK